jgi:hypothetical protein
VQWSSIIVPAAYSTIPVCDDVVFTWKTGGVKPLVARCAAAVIIVGFVSSPTKECGFTFLGAMQPLKGFFRFPVTQTDSNVWRIHLVGNKRVFLS